MPYIIVDLQGARSAGGFLKIDGGKQIALSDDLVIPIAAGVHNLQFSSQSSAQRGLANLNAAVGNYRLAASAEKNAVDGIITETFYKNSMMRLVVVSDASGHILDLPQYQMSQLDENEIKEIEEICSEREVAAAEYEQKTIKVEFLLCLILGWIGAHKFYRGKMGGGLLYLITMGMFGLGWFLDSIVLLFKWLKLRKA